jgi:hypothetical protein
MLIRFTNSRPSVFGASFLVSLCFGMTAYTPLWAGAEHEPSLHEVPLVTRSAILQRILTSPDPQRKVSQGFGNSVAISGGTIVTGAPGRVVNGQQNAGEGYVVVEPAGGWGSKTAITVAELTAADALSQVWPELGWGVAIDGDTVVLGAVNYGAGTHEAYVYVKPANGWATTTESARLHSPNQRYQLGGNGAVAIQGDTIIAECHDTNNQGASGAVAVYVKPPQGWIGNIMPVAVLTDDSADSLGYQLRISRDTIAAGAPEAKDGTGKFGSGAVQIYERPAGGWLTTKTPTATLSPSDPSEAYLGYSLGMSGDTVVAGCPFAFVNGQPNGAAYVFVRNGEHWKSGTQRAKLSAVVGSIPLGTAGIGISVAIQGNSIAVGANSVTPPDGETFGGELYIYKKPASGWHDTLTYEGIAYDPKAEYALQLGTSAAIEGDTFLAGALAPNEAQFFEGAVYIFKLP